MGGKWDVGNLIPWERLAFRPSLVLVRIPIFIAEEDPFR